MILSFIGDIMLGRFVSKRYKNSPYEIISKEVKDIVRESDFVIANLESPITTQESLNSLAFAGDSSLLKQFKWVNLFSLSNNHINDFGDIGIIETKSALDEYGIAYNGVYKDAYKPFLIENSEQKIAIVTCTDMLNDEFDSNSKYHVLRSDSPMVNRVINYYSKLGYFVLLFSHCGSLFSRFPNPQIRNIIYSSIDSGAKCVVTCHAHCLGGMDIYKDVPIFYSLGDFLMDGGSYRRRRSCILKIEIKEGTVKDWSIEPTITDIELNTVLPSKKKRERIVRGFARVSKKIQKPRKDYSIFYKWQYKVEILNHSLSTLHFLYDTKGIFGFIKMLGVRIVDVKRMIHRMVFDRTNLRYDSDAVYKKLKNSDIQ